MSVLERPQLGTDFILSHGDQLYEAEQGTDSCQSVVRELCYIQLLSASVTSGLGHCWGWGVTPGLGLEKRVCSLFLLTWLSLPRVPASSLSTLPLTLENLVSWKGPVSDGAQEGQQDWVRLQVDCLHLFPCSWDSLSSWLQGAELCVAHLVP